MIKLPEGKNFFDFFNDNLDVFTLETVYIGDKKDKAIAERSLSIRVKIKNTIWSFLGIMVFIGGSIGGTVNFQNDRVIAHTCPDLKSEIKLIDNIKKDIIKLQRTLKQMVFDQKMVIKRKLVMRVLILFFFFFFQACNAPLKIQDQAQEQDLNCSVMPQAEVKPCCSLYSKQWIEACLPLCENVLIDVDFERQDYTYQKLKCLECSSAHSYFLKGC